MAINLQSLHSRINRLNAIMEALVIHKHRPLGLRELTNYLQSIDSQTEETGVDMVNDWLTFHDASASEEMKIHPEDLAFLLLAGGTLTGDLTLDGADIIQTADETVFGVDLAQHIAGCLQGSCHQDLKIDAGKVTLSAESSKQITCSEYLSAVTYMAFGIRLAAAGATVDGVTRDSATTFTLYMSGSYTGDLLWITYGKAAAP